MLFHPQLALRSESNFSLGDNLGYSFFSSRNKNALSRNFTVGTSSISHSPEVCGCGGDEDSEKADMVATLASFVFIAADSFNSWCREEKVKSISKRTEGKSKVLS